MRLPSPTGSIAQSVMDLWQQKVQPYLQSLGQQAQQSYTDELTQPTMGGALTRGAQSLWQGAQNAYNSASKLGLDPMTGLMAAPMLGASLVKDVGLGAKVVGEGAEAIPRSLVKPTYFSNVLDAFSNPKIPNKLSRDQALSVLKAPGVKSEENKWLGMEAFLKGKDRWSKDEIQQYIRDNQIDVHEATSEPPTVTHQVSYVTNPLSDETFKQWRRQEYQNGRLEKLPDGTYKHTDVGDPLTHGRLRTLVQERLATDYSNHQFAVQQAARDGEEYGGGEPPPIVAYPRYESRNFPTVDEAEAFKQTLAPSQNPDIFRWAEDDGQNASKYSEYTLPGGDNYREVKLTWGNKNNQWEVYDPHTGMTVQTFPTREAAQANTPGHLDFSPSEKRNYESGHFPDDPNLLAHFRVNDRTTPDGKKMLFVEEVQSDWQKALRKMDAGPVDPKNTWDYTISKMMHENGMEPWAPIRGGQNMKAYEDGRVWSPSVPKVPDAPLARNYAELAMKRILRMASEQGYDSVGWTTGAQQAKRYNQLLEDNISHLSYSPESKELTTFKPNGETATHDVSVSQLPNLVGKDVAEKLMQRVTPGIPYTDENAALRKQLYTLAQQEAPYSIQRQSFLNQLREAHRPHELQPGVVHGSDLKVGERGYSDLYDSQLRNIANKLGKQFGATVTQDKLSNLDEAIHRIDLTPSLKDSIIKRGLPLFQVLGAAGLGAAATAASRQNSNRTAVIR